MKVLLFVCCLFLSTVLAQVGEGCLENSYATNAARQVAAREGLETGTNAAHAFNQLYSIFSEITGPRVSLFYAIEANENYYALEDCSSPVFNGYAPCSGQAGLVFGWRARAAYGDNDIHYFAVAEDGTVDTNSDQQLIQMGPFNLRDQAWYRPLESGWTVNTYLSPGPPFLNVNGSVYNAHFITGSSGANRFNGEDCGACLTGSFPFAWSLGYAGVPIGAETDDEEGVQAAGKALIDYVRGMTQEIFLEAYVGFENGNFYDIGDCRHRNHGCPSNATYAFFVRNDAVYPAGHLNTIYLDAEGNFLTTVHTQELYDPTVRPWYIIGNGWSRFVSTTVNETILAYSADFQGGVVASEVSLGLRGECEESRNGDYDPNFYCPGSKLVATLALVLAALALMMF